jgi:hypothetical protein
VKLADVVPSLTEVAPVKPEPVIVTDLPVGPYVGEKPVIFGVVAVVTVNDDELVPVPAAVVTAIGPVVAPLGTFAVILMDEPTV